MERIRMGVNDDVSLQRWNRVLLGVTLIGIAVAVFMSAKAFLSPESRVPAGVL